MVYESYKSKKEIFICLKGAIFIIFINYCLLYIYILLKLFLLQNKFISIQSYNYYRLCLRGQQTADCEFVNVYIYAII